MKIEKFSKEDLNKDSHLYTTPLITYYDYKKCLFPIHRILAYFFQFSINNFSGDYFLKARTFINSSVLEEEIKQKILQIIEDLIDYEGDKNFAEACIHYYTGENLCYMFNKV